MTIATAKPETAPARIESGGWVQRPGGLLVSERRLYSGNGFLSLEYMERMSPADIVAFNQEAGQYDVHIGKSDPPIDRLVKVCVYLSRRDNDGSALHTKAEYDSMLIDTATANTREQEPLASFYRWLKSTHQWDVTRDVLKFLDKQKWGMRQALLQQFNENGELVPVDEIKIMVNNGFIELLGTRGYPVRVSDEFDSILNLADTPLSGSDSKGFSCFFSGPPAEGEEKITLCGPCWGDVGLFGANVSGGRSYSSGDDVGALRLRRVLPKDFRSEISAERKKAGTISVA